MFCTTDGSSSPAPRSSLSSWSARATIGSRAKPQRPIDELAAKISIMSASEHTARYIGVSKEWRSAVKSSAPGWLNDLRQDGIANFAALGFPTPKQEEWKYTNVEPVVSRQFGIANGESSFTADILSSSFVEPDAPRLVFVNGVYAPALSSVQGLPSEVRLANLSKLLSDDDGVLASRIGRYANHRRNAFVALNTAFVDDGAVVLIPPGCRLLQPIYLVYASGAKNRPIVSHPRTLIIVGAGSEVSIVESYSGVNGESYFCNAVTELIGESDSVAHHYRLQRDGAAAFHTGTLAVHLGRGCHLTAHAVT